MQIAGREISSKLPPYIVAEIGGNHGGLFSNALALVNAAKEAGADAVKLQCFEADRITLDCDKRDFIVKDGPWAGRRLYDLYAATQTPKEWFPFLFQRAQSLGITAFSSVFSPEDVDFLESYNCPAYKIASMEITDIPLIIHAANTNKPLIISTGMATEDEISEAIRSTFHDDSTDVWDMALLHCVSGYPTNVEDANLRRLKDLDVFMLGPEPGISDHTLGWEVPVAATALGATIIEKHFKLYKGPETEDSAFSLDELEFAAMCQRVRSIWQAMQPSERKSEQSSRQARRSLYIVKDIKAGDKFTTEHVRSIRPAYGMPPSELSRVLKSHAATDLERGTALEEGMLMPF